VLIEKIGGLPNNISLNPFKYNRALLLKKKKYVLKEINCYFSFPLLNAASADN
jgi:hypothetical protein